MLRVCRYIAELYGSTLENNMNILNDFIKTSIDKSEVDNIRDVVGSMHLIDFGIITRQYKDGTCDITCVKKTKIGTLMRYKGVEVLYPCGIKNVQNNQMCLIVNPYSSVYRTSDIENPDFLSDHDIRCIKAIPISSRVTEIFAGINAGGDFVVANKYSEFSLGKWISYFGTTENGKAGVSIYQDGTVIIDACNGKVHMLMHNSDGVGLVHYDSNYYALEALVMQPDGKKYNKFFCLDTFTFTNISDILNSGLSWKRTEYIDLDGILHIYTGAEPTALQQRHLATSEDLEKLWDAFLGHSHANAGAMTSTLSGRPHDVAGIIVQDGNERIVPNA